MAGLISHLYIAHHLLEKKGRVFFPPKAYRSDSLRAAFFAGALAPDMGYFPGSDSFLSALPHYVRSKDFVVCLLSLAKTPEEKAFGYGWITHFYGDLYVHPFFNKRIEHLVPGFHPQDYDLFRFRPKLVHMQIETGYDLHLLNEHPFLAHLQPVFPTRSEQPGFTLLQKAFRKTYGYTISSKDLRFALRSFSQGVRFLRAYYRFLLFLEKTHWAPRVVRFLTKLFFFYPLYGVFYLLRKPAVLAFLSPRKHTQEAFLQYRSLLDTAIDDYVRGSEEHFSRLRNSNLDTGRLSVFGKNKYADIVMRRWLRLRKNFPVHFWSGKIRKYVRQFHARRVRQYQQEKKSSKS